MKRAFLTRDTDHVLPHVRMCSTRAAASIQSSGGEPVPSNLILRRRRYEVSFRGNGALFRSQTVSRVEFATNEGNEVAACLEPEDFEKFMEIFESPATAADGVGRDTVKVYVLDKNFLI